jgi:WD40 repeat protein
MRTFEIAIQRQAGDTWPVVVEECEEGVFLPVRTEGVLELSVRALHVANPSEYGVILGRALFRDAVLLAFTAARARSDACLHIQLCVEDPGMRVLRWERLHAPLDGGRWAHLTRNQRTPFSLIVPSICERVYTAISRRDMRALIVVSRPERLEQYGFAKFDAEEAIRAARDALGPIPADVLGPGYNRHGRTSLDAICKLLTVRRYTLLHVVAHGRYRKDDGEPTVFLEREWDADVEPVPASRLIERLQQVGGVRGLPHLAFLTCCEAAHPDAEGVFGGLGQRMVRELGIPAVLAMTDRISVPTALELSRVFYERLREHGLPDLALVESYAGIGERADIVTPVPALFSRLGARPLFQVVSDSRLSEADITHGLERLIGVMPLRAPVLLEQINQLARSLRDPSASNLSHLSPASQEERSQALIAVKALCQEVTDLSFQAVADDQPLPLYDHRCPFRGLESFNPLRRPREDDPFDNPKDDASFFFGRDDWVNALVSRLEAHPFLPVLGPSGSGKSSLVLAGLLPALERKSPGLKTIVFNPGADPLQALATALEAKIGASDVLVVDQFEELFTLCNDAAVRHPFFDALLKQSGAALVVLTMRADFWGDCANYAVLREEMQAHQVLVPPMTIDEMRTAMENQARAVQLRFDPGLVSTILADLADEPGGMPLLQHALLELWNRRHGRWLRSEEYQASGQVQGAIARTAEAVYQSLRDDRERSRVRDIFLRLTRLGESPAAGGLRRDTRRRVTLDQLTPVGESLDETRRLVNRLADRRLVVSSTRNERGPVEVEVVHEALIRHWPRLRGWLDEDPVLIRQREEIGDAARAWEQSHRSGDRLNHHGEPLLQAEAALRGGRIEFTAVERQYLEACMARRESDRVEREARQRREVRFLRVGLLVASVLIAFTATAVIIGWIGWSVASERSQANDMLTKKYQAEADRARNEAANAQTQSRVANSWRISEQAAHVMNTRHDLALLLAVEAYRLDATAEARDTLFQALNSRPQLKSYLYKQNKNIEFKHLIYSPGNSSIAASFESRIGSDTSSGIMLWAATARRRPPRTLPVPEGQVRGIAFKPDGGCIAAVLERGAIVWDVSSESRITEAPLSFESAELSGVVFSPNGLKLACGFDRGFGSGGGVLLWDTTNWRKSPDVLVVDEDGVGRVFVSPHGSFLTIQSGRSVNFSPDGRFLATQTGRSIILWDVVNKTRITARPLFDPEPSFGGFSKLKFSPDCKILAAQYYRGVILWDLNDQKRLTGGPPAFEEIINDIDFSPDGRTLALALSPIGLGKGRVALWDMASMKIVKQGPPPLPDSGMLCVSYSPDGHTLAAGYSIKVRDYDGGGLLLWDVPNKRLRSDEPITIPEGRVSDVSFSPDSRSLATLS